MAYLLYQYPRHSLNIRRILAEKLLREIDPVGLP